MGRWFGYRPNYDDLCHIWMSDEALDCYAHITKATQELRYELEEMRRYDLTPLDYGLMVRSHPENIEAMVGKLLVTARNKMQSTEEFIHTVSVSQKLIETPRFLNRISILEHNFDIVIRFINDLGKYKRVTDAGIYTISGHPMWENIPATEVAALVRDFLVDPMYLNFQADSLAEYIIKMPHPHLWDVVIPSGEASKEIKICNELVIHPEERFTDTGRSGATLRINGDRSRVGSRPCTKYGLTRIMADGLEKSKREGIQSSDTTFLINNRKPLLILHFISINAKEDNLVAETKGKLEKLDKQLVAIGLGFPRVLGEEGNQRVRYIINKVKQQQLLEAFTEVEDADDL